MIEAFSPDYEVRLPYRVLNAANFGVPQNRRRLFLVGARLGNPLPTYPEIRSAYVTVDDALSDLPDADAHEELRYSDQAAVRYGSPSRYAAVMRGLSCESDDFGYSRASSMGVLTASLRTEHRRETRIRFEATPCGRIEPISRLHRLDPAVQSNTIRAGTASDRGALTSPRPIHPVFPRVITNREAARLQSFPDWFRFHVTKWHGFRQIGNSVPPLLARAVASGIIEAMNHRPRKPSNGLTLADEPLLHLTMEQAARCYGVRGDVIPKRRRSGRRLDVNDPLAGALRNGDQADQDVRLAPVTVP